MNEAQRETAQRPLKEWEKWMLSSGTMCSTMQTSIYNVYYNFFLTNVVMISPAISGIITVIGKFLGILWAPIKGGIMQNKSWKTGKYRTWLMYFAPIGIAFASAQLINVQAAVIVQAIYYISMYVMSMIFGAFTETAQIAILPLCVSSHDQVTELTSKRSTIATFGQVLYALIAIRLATLIGGGDATKGYFPVYVIFATCFILCNWLAAKIAKPYDLYPVEGAKTENNKVEKKAKEFPKSVYFSSFFKNPPVMMLFFGDVCKAFASMIYMGAIYYYLALYVGNVAAMSNFFLFCNVAMLVGSYIAYPVAKKIGKKAANTLAYGGFALGLVAAYFIGVGQAWGVTACIAFGRFFSGLNASLSPAMYKDIGDNWENKTGYKLHAYLLTFFSLNFSVATLFTSAVINFCLAAVGYSAAVAATGAQLNMMLMLISLIPGIPLAIATVVSLFYPLNEKKMEEVRAELAAKNAAK